MKWNRIDIDNLKAKIDLLDVANRLGIDVKRGRARCLKPFQHAHGDRTPSMSVSSQNFKCWVCDEVKGDVVEFVKLSRGMTFLEAIEWLAQEYNYQTPSFEPQSKILNPQNLQAPPPNLTLRKPKEYKLDWRHPLFLKFLQLCNPVGGKERAYLNKRKIFKDIIDKQKLRMVGDYSLVQGELKKAFSKEQLIESGLFNENGYLRYFKHTLIFPYLDFDGKVCYFQSRAVEQDTHPKELNPRGRIPLPYNAPALKSDVNSIYIAEGAIDCLTILEKGFVAVGIPGAKNFKEDWVPYFKNKKVYLAFDRDRVGREGEMQIKSLLDRSGIECHFMQEHLPKNMQMPDGFDVNDWFVKKK